MAPAPAAAVTQAIAAAGTRAVAAAVLFIQRDMITEKGWSQPARFLLLPLQRVRLCCCCEACA